MGLSERRVPNNSMFDHNCHYSKIVVSSGILTNWDTLQYHIKLALSSLDISILIYIYTHIVTNNHYNSIYTYH
jgi:hypothetical protein